MRFYSKLGVFALILVGVASASYAQSEGESEPQTSQATEAAESAPVVASAEDINTVVATVNGENITLGEVLVVKQSMPPQYLQGDEAAQMKTLVDQIAVQHVLAAQAEESAYLDLKLSNVVLSTKAQANIQDYVNENLTDEYIQEQYDMVIGSQPEQTEWDASHILVESEDDARAVKARLDDGEDFSEVAKEVSTDPGSAASGGDLGWFGPGQMTPKFEEAAKSLDKGAVSEPVQTDFGWHIIRLNDTRVAEKPSLEEVKPQLEQYAEGQLINQYVEETQSKADIQASEGVDPTLINRVLPE